MFVGETIESIRRNFVDNFNDYRTDGETRRTQWILVFDQKALTAEFYRWEDWQKPYSLKLQEDQWR